MSDKFTIGEISKKAMIAPSTIRLWIQKSLIKPPVRSWNGYRLFTSEDLEKILKIKEKHFQINVKIGQQLERGR